MKNIIKSIKEILKSDEIRILPSSLAYSFFMSLIPIISLIVYVISRYNLPNDLIQNFMQNTFPKGVVDLLSPVFNSEMTIKSALAMIIAVIVAMNGCNSIIVTSNTIYKFKNGTFIRREIKSLFLVIMLIILFAFIFVVPLLGRTIINLIGNVTSIVSDNKDFINKLYFILQVPVSIIIMFYLIKIVYIIAPDEKIIGKYVNKGAIFTTLMWLISTLTFSYYINNIADYSAIYGNLANIIILLLYFYILAYIFVIGLFLNKQSNDIGIEKTNTIKLDEIREKVNKKK